VSDDHSIKPQGKSKRYGRLSGLSYREKMVLVLRLGLGEHSPMSTEQVGAIFKVSRARIRQIELGAMEKLKKYLEAS